MHNLNEWRAGAAPMKYGVLVVSMALLCGCHHGNTEWAFTYTGGDQLKHECDQRTSNLAYASICTAYILGAFDTYSQTYQKEHGTAWICTTPKAIDIVNATSDYMAAHPDQLSESAGSLVVSAVTQAYGCKPK